MRGPAGAEPCLGGGGAGRGMSCCRGLSGVAQASENAGLWFEIHHFPKIITHFRFNIGSNNNGSIINV